jgi:diguanylate cyclase (GGDEF)-like protein
MQSRPDFLGHTARLVRRHQLFVAVVVAAALIAGIVAIALARDVEQEEYARTDARLAAELAGAVRAVETLGADARARAVELAASAEVQRALAARDTGRLRELAARSPGVGFEWDGRRVPPASEEALLVRAAVVADGRDIGRVAVELPIAAVAERTALAPGDRLVAARVDAFEPTPDTLELDGRRYRARSTTGGPARLTALAPEAPIAAAVSERRERIVLAVLASFLSVVLIAVLVTWLVRPSTRRLRRSGDEPPLARGGRRTRQAATLVGEVLAAGHDFDALVPVILESAVAVTGAASASLVSEGVELGRVGEHLEGGGPPLAIGLSAGPVTSGLLVLEPPRGRSFDDEAVQLAEWLAGRASIALQNAHLHRVTRQLASTDELTQLANRRQFDEALAAEVVRAERFRDPVAVVLADLDNFKTVNDRFGHDVGDLVLRAFAGAIRATVRDVDLPARYGGEEFTVLLPATDAEGGRQLAERLRVAAAELAIAVGEDREVRVTSSFGVASFPDEPTAAALMRAADRAMYRAKAAGKNMVVVAERASAALQ